MNNNTKETIEDLPLGHFQGTVTVIEDTKQIGKITNILSKTGIVGFDTETKPSFKKGAGNQIALLQLCTSDEAFLFRINKIGFHSALIKLFEDDSVVKVGVGIRDDLRGLKKLKLFKPAGFVDLQDLSKTLGLDTLSLKGLAAEVLNLRISKRQRLTNWEADKLTKAQIAYAATDAWIALCIYNQLMLSGADLPFEKINFNN